MRFLGPLVLGLLSANEFRSQELLPDLITPIGVEFALPSDYMAVGYHVEPSLCDWVYWVPKDKVEAFQTDSLQQAVIRVRLSANTIQTSPGLYTEEEIRREMASAGVKVLAVEKLKWGSYPVVALEGEFSKHRGHVAWVGLNQPGGHVLNFHLFLPPQTPPTANDLKLWNDLLHNTKGLSEQLFIQSQGQDMQEGYTVITLFAGTAKATAERRLSDQKVLVTLTTSPHVEFTFDGIEMTRKGGGAWRFGDPIVKLAGTFTSTQDNSSMTDSFISNIFIKDVEAFYIDPQTPPTPHFFLWQPTSEQGTHL